MFPTLHLTGIPVRLLYKKGPRKGHSDHSDQPTVILRVIGRGWGRGSSTTQCSSPILYSPVDASHWINSVGSQKTKEPISLVYGSLPTAGIRWRRVESGCEGTNGDDPAGHRKQERMSFVHRRLLVGVGK